MCNDLSGSKIGEMYSPDLLSMMNTALVMSAVVIGAAFALRFYRDYSRRSERQLKIQEQSLEQSVAAAYQAREDAERRELLAKEAADERERHARELALEREHIFEQRFREQEYELRQMARERELAEERAKEAGGFQFFEVTEEQKGVFIDAFNGFKEYASLKGYNVVVLVDSSRQGLVGLKITITDVGTTVSTSQVRRDVNEYIRKMAEQDDLSDMPMVTDPIEHLRLVAAICTRFGFLRHQAEMNATAAQAYRAMIATVG